MEVNVGSVSFTVTVPQDGDPTVVFNVPDGAITVNTKTATVVADTSVTIDTPATTITGTLQVDGAVTTSSTITATGEITGNNVALSAHTHGVTTATGTSTPPPSPEGWPTSAPITTP